MATLQIVKRLGTDRARRRSMQTTNSVVWTIAGVLLVICALVWLAPHFHA